jgi:hypothetical protein
MRRLEDAGSPFETANTLGKVFAGRGGACERPGVLRCKSK